MASRLERMHEMSAVGFKINPILDETTFGLVVTEGVLAGMETYTQCYRAILDVSSPSPLTLVPKGFMKFSGLLPSKHHDLSDAPLFEHTFIPYYQHFVRGSVIKSIKEGLASDSGAAIRQRPGQLNTLITENVFLKFCPACAAEQKQKYHRTTWLRSHNLPGVDVCHKHGLSLRKSEGGIKGSFSVVVSFPKCEYYETGDALWKRGEVWWRDSPSCLIAQVSHELLYDRQCCNDQLIWENVYKRAVSHITNCSDKKVDWHALSAVMRTVYGDLIPKGLGLDFNCGGGETRHWLKRLLGYDCKIGVHQPILHVLLIGALFDSYSELKKAITEESARLDPSNSKFLTNNLPEEQVSNSLPIFPMVAEQREKLWIKMRTKHQNAILEMIGSEPNLSRMHLFENLNAAYRWFLKYDKAWLEERLPKRIVKYGSRPDLTSPRQDWTQLDKKVAMAISKVRTEDVFAGATELKNITLVQIARLAGVRYEKLLQIKKHSETYEVLSSIKPFRTGLELKSS